MQEKRKFGRIPFGTIVTVLSGGQSHQGALQDLSLNGARIHFDTPPALATATHCQLRLPLSADLILEFQGEVAYAGDTTIGIHFIQTDPESFSHLVRLMELNTGDDVKLPGELHKPV